MHIIFEAWAELISEIGEEQISAFMVQNTDWKEYLNDFYFFLVVNVLRIACIVCKISFYKYHGHHFTTNSTLEWGKIKYIWFAQRCDDCI